MNKPVMINLPPRQPTEQEIADRKLLTESPIGTWLTAPSTVRPEYKYVMKKIADHTFAMTLEHDGVIGRDAVMQFTNEVLGFTEGIELYGIQNIDFELRLVE